MRSYSKLPGGRWRFFVNRFLRIFPIYFVVLILQHVDYRMLGPASRPDRRHRGVSHRCKRGGVEELVSWPDPCRGCGTPDLQSAAIGSGAVRDFEGHLYVGTSSWLTCHVPFKKTDLFHGVASLPSPLPGKYYVADEQETAGACLNYLRDRVPSTQTTSSARVRRLPDVYRRFDALAATAPAGSHRSSRRGSTASARPSTTTPCGPHG